MLLNCLATILTSFLKIFQLKSAGQSIESLAWKILFLLRIQECIAINMMALIVLHGVILFTAFDRRPVALRINRPGFCM